jgi:hypothetical protein
MPSLLKDRTSLTADSRLYCSAHCLLATTQDLLCQTVNHWLFDRSVGPSVYRLNLRWASSAQSFLNSGLVETFGKDFLALDMYVFEEWVLFFDDGCDVCCTVLSA